MDIWLKPDNANKIKLVHVLDKKGFDKEGLRFIEKQNFENLFVFHIGKSPLKIDFLTNISGVKYSEANEQKTVLPMKDLFVPVIHLHLLLLS